MNDSLTQGPEEGGASAPPTKALYVKYALDGSVAPSSHAGQFARAFTDDAPTYAAPEAARKDVNFRGGWFWVESPRTLTGNLVMSGLGQIAQWVSLYTPAAPVKDTNPPAERVKDSNPKTVYGEAKPSLSLIPGPALIEVAMAMREGRTKYGSMNWREDPVSSTTYADAALRHLFQWLDGEDRCPKSGALHLAHLAANAMILIDAALNGTLIDDRPPPGTTSAAIDRNTRPIKGVIAEETA